MINFNQNSIIKLTPVKPAAIKDDIKSLLIDKETICCAFVTARDQLVFTDKRIIAVDVQGFTGSKKTFTVMPYFNIQYFSVETPALLEVVPEASLQMFFSNGFSAVFKFQGSLDIKSLSETISRYLINR